MGVIAAVTPDAEPLPDDERHAIGLPGMPNLHSHAFQRGMAGLAEHGSAGPDDFWTWRETMYRVALSVTPDDVEAIAAQLYVEMLEAGFTRVGEFHYLHHDTRRRALRRHRGDGEPRARRRGRDRHRHDAAAGLLCARRFRRRAADRRAAALHLRHRRLRAAVRGEPRRRLRASTGANIGIAPHSLRAVTPEELAAVARARAATGRSTSTPPSRCGRSRPASRGRAGGRSNGCSTNADVDPRWCLIHATHMTDAETEALAARGATAGLCPITEANLGDGSVQRPRVPARSGGHSASAPTRTCSSTSPRSFASSNMRSGFATARGTAWTATASRPGATLFEKAVEGGARALGMRPGRPRRRRIGRHRLAPRRPHHARRPQRRRILDAWIFAARDTAVDSVWVRGVKQVRPAVTHRRDAVRNALQRDDAPSSA